MGKNLLDVYPNLGRAFGILINMMANTAISILT